METVQSMIDAIIQLILFSLIPLIWWLFKGRKQTNLLEYLGLKKPSIKNTRGFIGVLIIDFVIILIQLFIVIPLFIDAADISTSAFTNRGLSVLFPVLIYAFVQTGLAEENFLQRFFSQKIDPSIRVKYRKYYPGIFIWSNPRFSLFQLYKYFWSSHHYISHRLQRLAYGSFEREIFQRFHHPELARPCPFQSHLFGIFDVWVNVIFSVMKEDVN